MSELISGKEALTKVADGIVQYKCDTDPVADRWTTITDHFWDQYNLGVFLNENTTWKFRLKPRTIYLNGIEVPAPFEPEHQEEYFYLNLQRDCLYAKKIFNGNQSDNSAIELGAWRTEEEIKQVVTALRSVFGKK